MDAARLQAIPLFAPLTDDDRAAMAVLAREFSMPAGQDIVREGDVAYDLIAIEEGTAEVIHDGEVLATLGAGDVFGEIGVLGRRPRAATVRAKEPVRLISWTSWDVKRLEKRAPEVVAELRRRIDTM